MSSTENEPEPDDPVYRDWSTRLRGHMRLSRLSNAPTVISNALAGAAIAGAPFAHPFAVAVAFAAVLFYAGGMYLNDLCDLEHDRRVRPDRPLVEGVVGPREATWVMMALFALGAGILWGFVGPAAGLCGFGLLGLITAYDVWHKQNPIAPLLMGGCRAMVYVTAYAAFVDPAFDPHLLVWAGLMTAYVVGLTAIARYESTPERTPLWPAALLVAPGAWTIVTRPSAMALVFAALLIGWIAWSIGRAGRRAAEASGPPLVAKLIAGIALVDATAMASFGESGGALIAVALFALTLRFQKTIEGT